MGYINTLSLSSAGGRIRVWVGEWPEAEYEPTNLTQQTLIAQTSSITKVATVAVELARWQLGHPSTYGLLGAEFTPDDSGRLVIDLATSDDNGPPATWALASSRVEDVRIGLPQEYVPGVLKGLSGVEEVFGAGRMRIACAAHGVYGSSQVIFRWLTRANISLIASENQTPGEEELLNLLKDIKLFY
jgi:hypothetical protein